MIPRGTSRKKATWVGPRRGMRVIFRSNRDPSPFDEPHLCAESAQIHRSVNTPAPRRRVSGSHPHDAEICGRAPESQCCFYAPSILSATVGVKKRQKKTQGKRFLLTCEGDRHGRLRVDSRLSENARVILPGLGA